VPSLQDDEMEFEHLLEEPRNDHVSLDGMLYLMRISIDNSEFSNI